MATSVTAADLSQIIREMLIDGGVAKKDLKTKNFSFVVKNTFMAGTLQNLMEELALSNENVIQIEYFFALDKPKPEQAIP